MMDRFADRVHDWVFQGRVHIEDDYDMPTVFRAATVIFATTIAIVALCGLAVYVCLWLFEAAVREVITDAINTGGRDG